MYIYIYICIYIYIYRYLGIGDADVRHFFASGKVQPAAKNLPPPPSMYGVCMYTPYTYVCILYTLIYPIYPIHMCMGKMHCFTPIPAARL